MELTKRQERALQNRQRLIDAARELIANKGYEDVTIDEIAAECGLSKGAFYYHFSSKYDIVISIERDQYEQLISDIGSMEFKSELSKLRCYIVRWLSIMGENNVQFARDWFRHSSNPDYSEKYGDFKNKMDFDIDEFRKLLDGCVTAGELVDTTPSNDIARTIVFALYGSGLYRNIRSDFLVSDWAESFADQVIGQLVQPFMASKGIC